MNVFEITEFLEEMQEDSVLPKSVRIRIASVISILGQDCEVSLRVNKSLQELEDVSQDPNLQPFLRTQLWQVASLLETVE
jgi:uncharacterized protein (UPF0147 family)